MSTDQPAGTGRSSDNAASGRQDKPLAQVDAGKVDSQSFGRRQGDQAVFDLSVELDFGPGAGGAGIDGDCAEFPGTRQVPAHPGQQGQGEQKLLDGDPLRAHGRIQAPCRAFCNRFFPYLSAICRTFLRAGFR